LREREREMMMMSEQMRIRPPDGQAAIGIDLGTSSLVAVWTSVTGTIPEVNVFATTSFRSFFIHFSIQNMCDCKDLICV